MIFVVIELAMVVVVVAVTVMYSDARPELGVVLNERA